MTPQPWLTAENILLLGANLFWAFYLLNRQWTLSRQSVIELFVSLISALALLAIIVKLIHVFPPTWHPIGGFGFFPNRNQTGNLLGSTIVLLFILLTLSRRTGNLFKWLSLGFPVATALVMNHSRAGFGIAFLGCLIWLIAMLASAQITRDQALKGGGILFVVGLLFFGLRWQLSQRIMELASVQLSGDFRVLLQQDTLRLIGHYPVTGIGLGNFASVFGLFQESSLNQKIVLHPESDWLWLAAEMGLFGVVASLVLIFKILTNAIRGPTDQVFRWGIFITAVLFCLHGFVDVSGHRMGTVWPVLLLVAIAQESHFREINFPSARLIKITGILLAGLLTVWALSWLPGTPRLNSLASKIDQDFKNGRQNDIGPSLAEALWIAPLDWRWHFYSGLVAANSSIAQSAFARANLLEPNSPELPLQEFHYWRQRDPDQAWFALNECLQRGGFSSAFIDDLAHTLRQDEPALEALWKLNRGLPENELLLLRKASRKSWPLLLTDLLQTNPGLLGWNHDQRQELFRLWAESPTAETLAAYLDAHADDLRFAWPVLARWQIQTGHFAEALNLIHNWQKPPPFLAALPRSNLSATAEGWQRDLQNWQRLSAAQDHLAAFALAQKLIQNHPRLSSFHYLSYESASALGQTETACREWLLFHFSATNL